MSELEKAVQVLGKDAQSEAERIGREFVKAEGAVFVLYDAYAKALGIKPTLPQWETARELWQRGAAAAGSKDTQKAWERFAKGLKSRCELVKPASTAKKAEAVSESRKREQEAVAALVVKPMAELQAEAKALLENPTPDSLKQTGRINAAIREKVKAQAAATIEQFKKDKAEAKARITALKSREVLSQVLRLLPPVAAKGSKE